VTARSWPAKRPELILPVQAAIASPRLNPYGHGESICIRSTYRALADELPDECLLGCLKYIDFRTETFDPMILMNFIIHKRKSFEHERERELRAVVWNYTKPSGSFEIVNSGKGLIVPINLSNVVQEVITSPDANPPFLEVVKG
jgi:hypothetical protein